MLVRFIYLLVLTFLASATKEASPSAKNSPKSTKIDSKLLLQDPDLPYDLFQDAMSSRKIKENATSDAPGSKNSRQLSAMCTDGQGKCQKCDESKTYCSICENADYLPNTSGSCTASKLTGCSIVSSEFKCYKCSANHYFDCKKCSTFVPNCITCDNTGQCFECADGYYINGDSCSLCSSNYQNCETCNKSRCRKCKNGFILDEDYDCVSSQSPNCLIYDSDDEVCDECVEGYYIDSDDDCNPCSDIENCELCDDSSTCTQCLAGFFLQDDTTCVSCSIQNPFCLACESDSECTQCDSTHYHTDLDTCANSGPDNCKTVDSNDLSKCIECLEGYNWDQSNKICKVCGDMRAHCAECDPKNYGYGCEKCDAGYILDSNWFCIKSPLENCQVSSNGFDCEECSNDSTDVCTPGGSPIDNCKVSNFASSYCVECILGYSYTEVGLCECRVENCNTCNADNGSICDTCIANHYEDCVACSTKFPYCDVCENGVCTKCSPGYYLHGSECMPCTQVDENCIACWDNGNVCSKCKPGFLVNIDYRCSQSSLTNCNSVSRDGKTCYQCPDGYFFNNEITCSFCGTTFEGCKKCFSSSACSACLPEYWLNSEGQCTPCSSIPGCQTCLDSSTCTKCDATYLLNEVNTCTSSSIKNCDLFVSNDPNTCQKCSSGYFWDSTECKACSTPLPNCDTCSSATACSLCKTGYYLDSIQCSACSNILENCLECSSDGSSCLKCDSGYFPNHLNKCTRSALNSCTKVSDDGACIACPSDKIFACTTSGGASLPNCAISSSDNSFCVKCSAPYENHGGKCSMCPDNCSACSSKDVCTLCDSGYFLYDKDGKTTCISCVDSCNDCEPNPSCFECANLVVQDGSTCRLDSVGYELSFNEPYIIVDFAHSSSRIYNIYSIEAFNYKNQYKDTTHWSISSRSATQLQIQTDNLRESDLPINLKFSLF